ncbi:DUF819 family protein [Venatoribacter cucullus]|uniref:DUF819 family protein n=1 Tax=Venatoribacter cucullus TaxID=2661630 RepID=A0A9X7UX85_9GAMM|nr:DUF819 family protein [Venatoribacter cucullus]QQD23680.1 DUF819 family protein [Venatoribacter cucullus]
MLVILCGLCLPALLIWLCQRLPWLDKAGVVVLSFTLGILLAASGVLPAGDDIRALQSTLAEVSVALALPLLVFSMDVGAALRLAGNTLKSLGLALLAVMLVSTVAAVLFAPHLNDIWQIAGMSVGAYTGGGPNMAAIKTAIGADDTLFTTMITYDILLSAMYLLFVMTIAKPIFSRLLPAFQAPEQEQDHSVFRHLADETAHAYKPLLRLALLPKTLLALLLAGVIVGAAVGIAKLVPGSMASAIAIIAITTLGVAASFVPAVRNLPNSYPLGMYLILVFCFTTGSMTDTGILTRLNMPLFGYISCILIGAMVLQALLCRWLKIDTDTFLITASAAIMSVPFIPVIAGALKNRALIVPGFAAAIIGYVLGNYLGIAVAWATRALI